MKRIELSLVGILLAALIGLSASDSQAATITVTNTADSGAGSLRAALALANPGDVIDIRTTGTVVLASPLPVIAESFTITGPGASAFAVSGNMLFRVFEIVELADVQISGITIRDGSATDCAGVFNRGNSLVLSLVVVEGNFASNVGGGVCAAAVSNTTIDRSRIINNTADFGGGLAQFARPGAGLHDQARSSYMMGGTYGLFVTNSTIQGNTAYVRGGGAYVGGDTPSISAFVNSTFKANGARGLPLTGSAAAGFLPEGGGIYLAVPTVTFPVHYVVSSTFSQNTSDGSIGAVSNYSALYLLNNTIIGNTAATTGGGVGNFQTFAGTGMIISSNIVAGNSAASEPDVTGTIFGVMGSPPSHNLIGNGSSNPNFINGTNANQVGTAASPIDPLVNPLGNYGGYTETYTLQPSSPAIDGGVANLSTTDQRGVARTNDLPGTPNAAGGDGTDIGSTEYISPTSAGISLVGKVVDADGRGISKARVSVVDTETGGVSTRVTNHSGRYALSGLDAGKTYIVSVAAKGYLTSTPQMVHLSDSLNGFDITLLSVTRGQAVKSGAQSLNEPSSRSTPTTQGGFVGNKPRIPFVTREFASDEKERRR